MSDLVAKSADALPLNSRNFYENAVFKTFLSMIWAALGLCFLGLTCTNGGNSRAGYYFDQISPITDDLQKEFEEEELGYGFAAFFFFCAFAIMIGAAFHISPLVNGSSKEATTLRRPLDLER